MNENELVKAIFWGTVGMLLAFFGMFLIKLWG